MSDIYIPGIRSRLNSEKMIEDLMKLESVPKERIQSNIERLENEKIYWQDVNRRTTTLQESARQLFSFQNPFNDRLVTSSDESILIGTAVREAINQDRTFTVRQTAQADRFLSAPLELDYRIESGNYTFSVGKEEISFDFRGGTLNEFTEALNRRGRDVLQSSLIAVKPGTMSLLIESKVTGEENRLGFADASLTLGETTGMLVVEQPEDDPDAPLHLRPLNPVSTARDAIISIEGIEVYRPSNEINDLVPGVNLTIRGVSDRPVRLKVEPDQEGVKNAIISFVGNYNRLMAEINILTRNDDRVIEELNYLSRDEKDEYRKRLGVFSGDSTLIQIRNNLMNIISTAYQNSADSGLNLLAQIGIGTDVRRSGGTDPSRLRGYLDIDEKVLDAAIASKLPAMKQLFGADTTGDLLVDTGVAFAIESLTKPYTESTGLFTFKTKNMDTIITQEQRRVETLDRQLASKEIDLRKQYSQMEGAYTRMEQMSSSLDRFQRQNSNN